VRHKLLHGDRVTLKPESLISTTADCPISSWLDAPHPFHASVGTVERFLIFLFLLFSFNTSLYHYVCATCPLPSSQSLYWSHQIPSVVSRCIFEEGFLHPFLMTVFSVSVHISQILTLEQTHLMFSRVNELKDSLGHSV